MNAKISIKKDADGIRQNTSRNGALLEQLLNDLELNPLSTKSETGSQTRVNRNDPDEKAIIDYVIKQKKDDARIIENIVHESGALKIKSAKETDHNTMMIS